MKAGSPPTPLPFEIDCVPIALYWNRRFELDGATRWMRDALVRFCQSVPSAALPFQQGLPHEVVAAQ